MELQDFDKEAADLKAKLDEIETQKRAAIERQRAEQLDKLAEFEELGESYRNQAEKAAIADKALLYRYADDADEQAFQLRKELGILPENVNTPDERGKAESLRFHRRINSLFFASFFSLIAYFLSDFTAGQIETGFISYLLKYGALILFNISAACGGVWLASIVLQRFMPSYTPVNFKADFFAVSPAVRLSIIAAVFAAILYFLSSALPHAN